MSLRILLICVSLAVHGFTSPDSAAYLRQTPPGDSAVVFAPGIISGRNTFVQNSAFSPDGKEFYFTETNARWDHFDILSSQFRNGKWTPPDTAGFFGRDSKPAAVMEPFLAPGGNRIYFSAGDAGNLDIWYCERTGDTWGTPVRLPDTVNSSDLEWHPTISRRGTLFLTRNGDIYYAASHDGRFDTMAKLGTPVNSTDYDEADPYISPNEDYLIFHSPDRPGGFGQADLYISYKKPGGAWTNPKNLGPKVNTEAFEFAPSVTPDGKYFMFSRRTKWLTDTPSRIYWIKANLIDDLKDTQETFAGYLDQAPPEHTPTVFTLQTHPGYFAGDRLAISADGKELFYSEVTSTWSDYNIRYDKYSGGKWNGPLDLFQGFLGYLFYSHSADSTRVDVYWVRFDRLLETLGTR
jgi:hypothetical protein